MVGVPIPEEYALGGEDEAAASADPAAKRAAPSGDRISFKTSRKCSDATGMRPCDLDGLAARIQTVLPAESSDAAKRAGRTVRDMLIGCLACMRRSRRVFSSSWAQLSMECSPDVAEASVEYVLEALAAVADASVSAPSAADSARTTKQLASLRNGQPCITNLAGVAHAVPIYGVVADDPEVEYEQDDIRYWEPQAAAQRDVAHMVYVCDRAGAFRWFAKLDVPAARSGPLPRFDVAVGGTAMTFGPGHSTAFSRAGTAGLLAGSGPARAARAAGSVIAASACVGPAEGVLSPGSAEEWRTECEAVPAGHRAEAQGMLSYAGAIHADLTSVPVFVMESLQVRFPVLDCRANDAAMAWRLHRAAVGAHNFLVQTKAFRVRSRVAGRGVMPKPGLGVAAPTAGEGEPLPEPWHTAWAARPAPALQRLRLAHRLWAARGVVRERSGELDAEARVQALTRLAFSPDEDEDDW